jgi:hypothetical protein
MNYAELKRLCAFYGFLQTPIKKQEFLQIKKAGIPSDNIYDIACDMHSGAFDSITDAIIFYTNNQKG